jgi:hypothetical protein
MKSFKQFIKEQFESDKLVSDDKDIIEYLKTNKIIIVRDDNKTLKKQFKKVKEIDKDKVTGKLNGTPAVFINIRIGGDNHFYYFSQKDEKKVNSMLAKFEK